MSNYIQSGIDRLRTKWPQSHAVPGDHGYHLITVPSVLLPKGYRERICTVLFVCPPGFPYSYPENFFTDIKIRLKDGGIPRNTNTSNPVSASMWPQWHETMWWNWKLQAWHPGRDGLFQYMYAILNRFSLVI